MGFYAESYDRPNLSAIANEDIHVGTVVSETSTGLVVNTDATDTSADGLALAPRTAEYIALDEDQTHDYIYDASEDERVPYLDLDEAGAVVKIRTIEDNSTDPAPSISDGDPVGIALYNDDAFRGRIVEEGYEDNSGTVYGRESGGDFAFIGKARRDSSSSFDEPVRVIVSN